MSFTKSTLKSYLPKHILWLPVALGLKSNFLSQLFPVPQKSGSNSPCPSAHIHLNPSVTLNSSYSNPLGEAGIDEYLGFFPAGKEPTKEAQIAQCMTLGSKLWSKRQRKMGKGSKTNKYQRHSQCPDVERAVIFESENLASNLSSANVWSWKENSPIPTTHPISGLSPPIGTRRAGLPHSFANDDPRDGALQGLHKH